MHETRPEPQQSRKLAELACKWVSQACLLWRMDVRSVAPHTWAASVYRWKLRNNALILLICRRSKLYCFEKDAGKIRREFGPVCQVLGIYRDCKISDILLILSIYSCSLSSGTNSSIDAYRELNIFRGVAYHLFPAWFLAMISEKNSCRRNEFERASYI